MTDRDFYKFLRDKHGTIETAIVWAIRWEKHGQPALPEFGEFTLRAMSFHISMAFEGRPESNLPCTDYLNTKYGSRIFNAMCIGRDDWRIDG